MSAAQVWLEPYVEPPRVRSAPDILRSRDRSVSRQVDELVRVSKSAREKELGSDWAREARDLYTLKDADSATWPSFQPRISIPQLQILNLTEATDISDSVPKLFITLGDGRDQEREKYFQGLWRGGFYNSRILEAIIWALYTNQGFLQIGFDPLARHGRGQTWIDSRDPSTVFVDPYAKRDDKISFCVWQDWMYLDEVKWRWPQTAGAVRPRYISEAEPGSIQDVSLDYPEMSPLSVGHSGLSQKIFRDSRVLVQTCFCFDNARERIRDYAGTRNIASDLVSDPQFRYKYPDGRWITECEGVILADGNNWVPKLPGDDRGTFPLVRIAATPALHNIYGPPPIRFTKSLQFMAERLYTQLYENMVRLNNGVIVIKSNTGLTAPDIGWLPGEILTIHPNSDPPQVIAPSAFPQHMLAVPQVLLALQKELMGYNNARQGDMQPGNISADLFDASLWSSQALTRMRARLLSEPLQRLAEIVVMTELRYKNLPDRMIDQGADTGGFVNWNPANNWEDYDVELDQGSLRILSATALRSVVGALAKANMLPTSTVLEAFGIPRAEEVASEKMKELELGALQRLRRPR